MKKVIIIGCPGAGKSTFARKLSEATGLPLVHLDMLYWNEDKTHIDTSALIEKVGRVMAGRAWIIDGNYLSTLEMRLQCCDTVFFLDIPAQECLRGIEERRGKARADMPWIESETDEELVAFVKSFSAECRPKMMAMMDKYDDKNIVVFKTREQIEDYLMRLYKKI